MDLGHLALLEHLVGAHNTHERELLLVLALALALLLALVTTVVALVLSDEQCRRDDLVLERLQGCREALGRRSRVVLTQDLVVGPAEPVVLLCAVVLVRVVLVIAGCLVLGRVAGVRARGGEVVLLVREELLGLALGALLRRGDVLVDGHGEGLVWCGW